MSSRSVQYTSSPLLASKTPIWRSQFIVAFIALGFLGLVVRAAYVQVIDNAFFKRQGTVRFVRTLDLPANRGRILDRNGHILASSVPVPSIWASPEDIDRDPAKLKALAKLLNMSTTELDKKLVDEDKNFVWIKRQVDEDIAKQIDELKIKGVHARKEYKRIYPEGESVAHVVGFTNVENIGQEGVELTFNQDLGGRAGSRRVIKDRLGRVVEDVGEMVPPVDGRDLQLSIDSKVQFFAYEKIKEAVVNNKAAAGSVVVLDVKTGEILALTNYPSYSPGKRGNLSGAQLRNRALTDTFEPGSTMKPFAVALALEKGLVKPETPIQTAPGRINITGSTITDAHPHGVLTVNEIIQKSSNVGTVKLAMQIEPRETWDFHFRAQTKHGIRLDFFDAPEVEHVAASRLARNERQFNVVLADILGNPHRFVGTDPEMLIKIGKRADVFAAVLPGVETLYRKPERRREPKCCPHLEPFGANAL